MATSIWRAFEALVALVAVLTGVSLAGIGIYKLGEGIFLFVSSRDIGLTISSVLKGLELLFLAPLPYITVVNLAKYLRFVRIGAAEGSADSENDQLHAVSQQLAEAKAMVVSLMAAVVGTDAVSRVLGGELSLELAAAEALVVAVLVGYYVVLQRSHSRH